MSKRKTPTQAKAASRPKWLIPAIVVGVLATVAALVAVLSGNNQTPFEAIVKGAPRAEVAQTSNDHGNKPFQEVVTSTYTIRNIGDQALLILGEPRVELLQGC